MTAHTSTLRPDTLAPTLSAHEVMPWVDELEQDDGPSDREILEVFQREDAGAREKELAFTTFMIRHQGTIRRFVGQRGVPDGVADDIVQHTFLKAYSTLSQIERATTMSWETGVGWLITISRNRHLDYVGWHSTLYEVVGGDMTSDSNSDVPLELQQARQGIFKKVTADIVGNPLAAVIALQEQADYDAWFDWSLQKLTKNQQHACEAVYGRGLSLEEAAAEAGVSVGALKSRLHLGTANLRVASLEYYGLNPESEPDEALIKDAELLLKPANEVEAAMLERLARHFENKYDAPLMVAVYSGRISMAQAATLAAMTPGQFAGRYQRLRSLVAS